MKVYILWHQFCNKSDFKAAYINKEESINESKRLIAIDPSSPFFETTEIELK